MENDPVSEIVTVHLPSSHVRFTRDEYLRLRHDQMLTGKSVPQLLKETYFECADFRPMLDVQTRNAVRREMSYIGNNINQIAKYLHTGLMDDWKDRFLDVQKSLLDLRKTLGLYHGNS